MEPNRPYFLITIDTEGDNLWARPRQVRTDNARYLPRFQQLCERHGLRPTYLVNYEMARCPVMQEFGRDLLRRGAGEIGMHLHAWNSPPLWPLTDDDAQHMPYLVEYPERVLRDKIVYLTDLLEEVFSVRMRSHRAGRWAMNALYARVLAERGYWVDCSVTPHVSWRRVLGDPRQGGGSDYSGYPEHPYLMDLTDIRRPGCSTLLEVPVTIRGAPRLLRAVAERLNLAQPLLRGVLAPQWLRPNGRNGARLRSLLRWALGRGTDCVQLMLHSSELMPGGSPTLPTQAHIDRLYCDLAALFADAAQRCIGATLSEYYLHFQQRHATDHAR
ncbi:MAG: hypothetical protein RMK29_02645 [Myxococcales bacterium]|nr:deacetylase [Myxococcota bacterium]MDW8280580.1 hypothetical protein [Myxococcales bacterium]